MGKFTQTIRKRVKEVVIIDDGAYQYAVDGDAA